MRFDSLTHQHDRYGAAEASISDREERMFQEQQSIEKGLELLGITGVEDKLQVILTCVFFFYV